MKTAVSHNGVPIRLNDERWAHVLRDHPELEGQLDSVLNTIEEPDWIWEGRTNELIAGRKMDDLYLLVAYREVTSDDGFAITAYLTRRPTRRKIVWKR